MPEDMWAGYCRDCFNPGKDLVLVEDLCLMDPPVKGMHLCPECLQARKQDVIDGLKIRPIGIPAAKPTGKWIRLNR
jgi:hypothetical protein